MSSGAVELGLDRSLWILEEIRFVFIWDVQLSTIIDNYKAGSCLEAWGSSHQRGGAPSACPCASVSSLISSPLPPPPPLPPPSPPPRSAHSGCYILERLPFPPNENKHGEKVMFWNLLSLFEMFFCCSTGSLEKQISTEPTAWPPPVCPDCLSVMPESQTETGPLSSCSIGFHEDAWSSHHQRNHPSRNLIHFGLIQIWKGSSSCSYLYLKFCCCFCLRFKHSASLCWKNTFSFINWTDAERVEPLAAGWFQI